MEFSRVYIRIISVPYSHKKFTLVFIVPIIPAAIGIISSVYPHLEILACPHHFVVFGIHARAVKCENPIAHRGAVRRQIRQPPHSAERLHIVFKQGSAAFCFEPFMEKFGHIVNMSGEDVSLIEFAEQTFDSFSVAYRLINRCVGTEYHHLVFFVIHILQILL